MSRSSPAHEDRVTPISAVAQDGVPLRGLLFGATEGKLAVVVGHGLSNHVARPQVQRVLRRLSAWAPVVALNFRGHRGSGGGCTVGKDEVLDVAAGVALARRRGFATIATVGFSMGASVVIRHAALAESDRPDAVVAISGPARWWVRETRAMRRVHWMLEQPHGRVAGRAIGVRLGGAWDQVPASPIEVVHRITPIPLLIVHGEQDQYFPPEQALALHRAAGGTASLWLEPGIRHAETAMTPQLVDRIGQWLVDNAGQPSTREEAA